MPTYSISKSTILGHYCIINLIISYTSWVTFSHVAVVVALFSAIGRVITTIRDFSSFIIHASKLRWASEIQSNKHHHSIHFANGITNSSCSCIFYVKFRFFKCWKIKWYILYRKRTKTKSYLVFGFRNIICLGYYASLVTTDWRVFAGACSPKPPRFPIIRIFCKLLYRWSYF